MAVKEIVLLGEPILRRVCQPISEFGGNELQLLNDLTDTLYAEPGRAGLAAPQIGIAIRMAVLDCDGELIELINPVLLSSSGEQVGYEACLSIPEVFGQVTRAHSVKVQTLTRTGKEVVIERQGFTAVCILHELDHLDGKLFLDHVEQGYLFHELTGEELDVQEWIRRSK
ncbi:peptide deformylase [Bacillus horti]|uniref:Peptide deformylase n=1 Tax=Caldalkalibacillus horti TaxID=77523 RepID=A0ABT9VXS1_9BACI|nr:peptide deformylase [Bacillus horti]MDQ0165786.1 peptide deformylase [Bacillus horti]